MKKITPDIVHTSMFSFADIFEILFHWKLFTVDKTDSAFDYFSLTEQDLKSVLISICNDLFQIDNKGR